MYLTKEYQEHEKFDNFVSEGEELLLVVFQNDMLMTKYEESKKGTIIPSCKFKGNII